MPVRFLIIRYWQLSEWSTISICSYQLPLLLELQEHFQLLLVKHLEAATSKFALSSVTSIWFLWQWFSSQFHSFSGTLQQFLHTQDSTQQLPLYLESTQDASSGVSIWIACSKAEECTLCLFKKLSYQRLFKWLQLLFTHYGVITLLKFSTMGSLAAPLLKMLHTPYSSYVSTWLFTFQNQKSFNSWLSDHPWIHSKEWKSFLD